MGWWLLLLALIALATLAVRFASARERWHWRELSLEARLREASQRSEVFARALQRLRTDYDAGKLQLNDDYRLTFEKLTAEAGRGGGDAAGADGVT